MELVGIGIFIGALQLLDCMATDLVVLLSPETKPNHLVRNRKYFTGCKLKHSCPYAGTRRSLPF